MLLNPGDNAIRARDIGQVANNHRTTTRLSRLQSKACNRQSIQFFADFNTFESPRGSRSQRAAERDEEHEEITPSLEAEPTESSAYSIYSSDKPLLEPPYHVFTLEKKKQLVHIVSAAAIFSPLSSNIYFPGLGQISTVC